jgi:two-component system phosphate regulon sensor histidine kinase PhoR
MIMLKGKALPAVPKKNEDEDHSRLLALINSMSDGVLAINERGEVALTNGVVLAMLDLNNIIGKPLSTFLNLIDKTGDKVDISRLILDSRQGFTSRDLRLIYPDNSSINLFLSISPVTSVYGGTDNAGFVIILRDITREKLVEEERDEFVSVAGHELRTPVTIAEGSLSNALLMANRSGLSEAVTQSLETAHSQVVFLSNMINDLAMLSRAERGKAALELSVFSPYELASKMVADYQNQAKAKNLTLNLAGNDKTPQITSSQLYVREILQNFLTNSLKYTETGGIEVKLEPGNGGVLFEITDTGIGISQADQKKLFSKFFRSEDARVKKVHGTGLGLYVTSKLLKLIDGNLEVASELNKGTSFKIFIPDLKLRDF